MGMKVGGAPGLYLLCCNEGFPEPEIEYPWAAPDRAFVGDLVFVEHRLVIEVDGGVYGRGKPCPLCGRRRGGAHSSINNILNDMDKTNTATVLGWNLLRFTPEGLENALPLIAAALKARGWEGAP